MFIRGVSTISLLVRLQGSSNECNLASVMMSDSVIQEMKQNGMFFLELYGGFS